MIHATEKAGPTNAQLVSTLVESAFVDGAIEMLRLSYDAIPAKAGINTAIAERVPSVDQL